MTVLTDDVRYRTALRHGTYGSINALLWRELRHHMPHVFGTKCYILIIQGQLIMLRMTGQYKVLA